MTVYVDDMHNYPMGRYRRMKMCHMVADCEFELSQMAEAIGVQQKWWQYKGTRKSHFDICQSKRKLAVSLGAVSVTTHQLGWLLKGRTHPNQPLQNKDKLK